jgi:hypothetical protein
VASIGTAGSRLWRRAIAVGALLVVVCLAAAGSAAAGDLGGEWHLDELQNGQTTPDSSGNGNDLTLNGGGSLAIVDGRFANAFNFANHGQLQHASAPSLEPQHITAMAWVRGSNSPGFSYLVSKGAGAPPQLANVCEASYALATDQSGRPYFYVWAGGASSVAQSPVTTQNLWDGNWHAVAGTFDGSTVRFYVDGQQVGNGTPTSTSIGYGMPNNDFRVDGIYNQCPGGSLPYQNDLDEVRVYDRALSDSEINQLQTAPGGTPPELSPGTGGGGGGNPLAPTIAHFAVGRSAGLKGATWFNGHATETPAGIGITTYAWDTDGNGSFDWNCNTPAMSIRFAKPGAHTVGLRVTDTAGRTATTTTRVAVAATAAGTGHNLTVVDCENPGANNQPDRGDCVKSFGFGLVDANSRGETSDCFQIQSTSVKQGALEAHPHGAALSHLFNYRATLKGPVALNGIYIPVPEQVDTVWDSGAQSVRLGNFKVHIGPYSTDGLGVKTFSVKPNAQGIAHFADVSIKGKNPLLGGLPIEGGVAIDLLHRQARTTVHLGLPPPIGFGGSQGAQGNVYLISNNVDGVKFDGLKLGPVDAFIGPVYVKKLQFRFIQSRNIWDGGAEVFLPGSLVGLDAAPPPPDLGFGLRNGRFDHGGVGLEFLPPAQPEIFPGISLRSIHVALGNDPLRFTGGIGISGGHVIDADGDVFVAFATPTSPYDFPADTGGTLAPFADRRLESFSIAVGGTVSLHVPVLKNVQLGDAYGLYEYPDFFEAGGHFEFPTGVLSDYFSISGDGNGFVLPSEEKFSIQGKVEGCLQNLKIIGFKIPKICLGAGAAVSTKGIGLCGEVPVPTFFGPVPVTTTVGYVWGDGVHIAVFDCDFGPYTEANPRSAQAGGGQSFTLPSGLPAAMIDLTGSGGTPEVTLTDPHGQTIDTANPPHDRNGLVMELGASKTIVGIKHPAGGRWTITPNAGSPPLVTVQTAKGLPAPDVKARVSGHGAERMLHYSLAPAASRTVTFAEQGRRTYRVLGTVRAPKGTIRFKPGFGAAERRSILSTVNEGGVGKPAVVVAHYAAPAPRRPALPRHLRVTRKGTTLRVSWSRASGATTYSVLVTTNGGGRTLRVTRAHKLQIAGIPSYLRGSVAVSGVRVDGVRGREARKPFRATRRKLR